MDEEEIDNNIDYLITMTCLGVDYIRQQVNTQA